MTASAPSLTRRIIFYSALYDLIVTAAFATPWTAALVLQQLSTLHSQLGLSGDALPAASPVMMLYINFFGTVVLMWSGLRLWQPTVVNGAVDSIGRLFFTLWMALALHRGASSIVAVFMALEFTWLIVQGGAVLKALSQPQRQALPC
jgi:hypothetical protein